jgi:ribosome-associated translation inhibitor RaiA
MNRVSLTTLLVGLGILALGCNRDSAPQKTATHFKASHKTSDRDPYNTSIEQSERLIERQAQRAKQDIDDVTKEAENALRKTQETTSQTFQARARQMSERAAELAEEAKDRAEDAPQAANDAAVDGLERNLQAIERRLHAKQPEEKISEDETEDDRR